MDEAKENRETRNEGVIVVGGEGEQTKERKKDLDEEEERDKKVQNG